VHFLNSNTSLLVHVVFSALNTITKRLNNCEYTVLNDIATVLYGLIKPVEEVRYLISENNVENILSTILEAHGVHEHYEEALKKLREQGLIAISTVFYPLVVIEIASGRLDKDVLSNTQLVDLGEYKVCIPRLEYLITKLLSMKLYPYTLYGYTLLFTWLNTRQLDLKLLAGLLKNANMDVKNVIRELESIFDHLSLFKPQELDKNSFEYLKALLIS